MDGIKERLDNGEKFEVLARQYSEDGTASNGGDLGWVNPGDTVPQFEQAMNALKTIRSVSLYAALSAGMSSRCWSVENRT